MRSCLIAAAAAICLSGPAMAQGSWDGAYVGVHGGGAWGPVSVTDSGAGVPTGPYDYSVSGAIGGFNLGYNWTLGSLLLGIEGDLGYMTPNGSGYIASSHPGQHQDLMLSSGAYGDFTGRLGFDFSNWLLYGKAGAAFFGGQADQVTTNPGYSSTASDTFGGWTAGVGAEYQLTQNLSVKAEYQHFGFENATGFQTALVADPPTPVGQRFPNSTSFSFDTVQVGLNFRF
jgi:outer membrane immunogenic protein